MIQTHLLDLPFEKLQETFSYRARQICDWVFTKRAREFKEMTSLPSDLRFSLSSRFAVRGTSVLKKEESQRDGTTKFTLKTREGSPFPCVFLPRGGYQSLCISTQVGCAWACAFCASGLVAFERNLTAGEILDQVFWAEECTGKKIRNVLFMGMGEPLANLGGTLAAIRWLKSPRGFALNGSRIVLSTTGLAPQILKISKEKPGVQLALSLHAPTDDLRRKIMPKSAKFSIQEVLSACKTYGQENGGAFTIEYILLKDVNDRPEHARALADLLIRARFPKLPKVNLIPQNPVPGIALGPATEARAREFFRILKSTGFLVHTRKPQGQDLEAACGQLQ